MRYIILLVSLVMTFSFQQDLLSQTGKSNPSKRKTFNLKSPGKSDLKLTKAEIITDSVRNYNDYEFYWQQVDSLEKLELTRTALGIAEDIYKAAKNEKNNPQIIKSLLVRLVYNKGITPGDIINVLSEFEKEIASSEKPLKNILQVILARVYSDYLHNNSYKIAHRSRLSSRPDDFRMWASKDFECKILELYTDAFSDSELLRKTDLSIYTPVISHPQTFDVKLTPTLYDLLAREAIENLNSVLSHFYSRNPEHYDDPALLEDIDSFLGTDLSKGADMPAYLFIENLFREMIKFHKKDESQGALLYADLYRLDFMHKHSLREDKDSLYLSSLERLKAMYSDEPFLPHVYFSLANYYDEKYNIYGGPEYDKSNKEIVEKILEISRQMLEKNYSEDLNNYAKALKNSILSKTLVFHFEENNLPDLPFRMRVDYRCVDKIFVRFIDHKKVQYEILKKFRDQDSIQMYYASLPYYFDSSYSLPVTNDYNQHNTELAIPPLPEGKYIVLAALDSTYSAVRANQYCWIAVTRLSCIVKCDNNELKIVVLDRLTGKPISGVEVDVNLDDSRNILRNHFISDNEGVVIWKDIKLSMFSYEILMKKGLDKCRVTDDSPYDFSSKPGRNSISIYLDRKIYRPGQTVHFKAIVYGGDKKKQEYKVIKDYKLTAVLINANDKEVQSLSLTTNEFGSAAGQFILPENMMNGSWKIYIENFGEYFSVEEYKRPAMEITIDKENKILRTNDTVRVTGRAATFSGAPVSAAEVNYEVVRRAELPFGKWKYYGFNNNSYSSKSGTVKTDAHGNFEVIFIADEDKKLKGKDPVYTFSLTLKIADPFGEVQQASASVRASEKILSAEADLPDIIINGSEKYRIYAQNLNGGKETARVDVKVFRLKSPGRIFRNRMWGTADRPSLSEREFHEIFPLDIYSDEDNYIFWDKDKLVYENSLITSDSSWIHFQGIENWLPGKYMMVMNAGDKYGGSTETIKYFTLADNKPGKYLLDDALFVHPLSSKAEPGSTIQVIIGTALENADIYLEAGCNDEIIEEKILHLNKEQILYSIPVKNRWRGGIYLKCIVIANNSWYREGLFIDIPWSNKTAQIKLETFRNKLTPGKDEQWRLRITDYKGKPAEAELLASMFDASLNKLYGMAYSWNYSFYQKNYPSVMYTLPVFNSTNSISAMYSTGGNMIHPAENYFSHFNFYGSIQNSGDFSNEFYKSRLFNNKFSEDYFRLLSRIKFSNYFIRGGRDKAAMFSLSSPEQKAMRDFTSANDVVVIKKEEDNSADIPAPAVRRNLNETAFFYPALVTDDSGDIILNFTSPEALTKWKFQAFAHTKDMQYAYIQKEVVTQKDLMVKPNHPRFLREGDTIAITARVSNLSENKLDGKTYIKLFDGNTMRSADSLFRAEAAVQNFSLEKNESKVFSWKLIVPYNSINVLDYQIFAETDNCSDGEENAVPVLTSSIFITETMPVNLKPLDNRSFSMTRLRDLYSKVQQNYRVTLEYTSNPVWLSLKALPYLMNTFHDNIDALFNRYYANSIAGYLMNSSPEIKRVFDKWGENSNAVTSNLEKNKELKSMLNQECPWAAESGNKANTYRELAGYFNLLKLNAELNITADKIISGQNVSGAWSWCPGMRDDQFITATIIAGFGHLKHLGINDYRDNPRLQESIIKGIWYLNDNLMSSRHISSKYDSTKKLYLNYSYDNMLSLYALSFFKDERMSMSQKGTMKLWMDTIKAAWQGERKNIQAMEALILYRSGDTVSAENIMRAVKENAVTEEDGSMYFKEKSGPYWYETAVESHTVIIEAFEEIMHDSETADRIKNWMLKQKQATSWGTSRATAEAIYALLMSGSNWIAESNSPEITIADKPLDLSEMEEGTGYIKKSWMKEEITPEMSEVKLVSHNKVPSWGGLYWQYFENMDKVTEAETELKINKKLYLKSTANGEELLIPVGNEARIKVGDEIIVRMEITSGRNMEYVYIKDMRAPGLEPVNVFSGSRYQDGLFYYETTKDASTNFYFGSLNKGVYILEYPLRAAYKGSYSAGVAVIQSMYAPEFTSHSRGIRITVE